MTNGPLASRQHKQNKPGNINLYGRFESNKLGKIELASGWMTQTSAGAGRVVCSQPRQPSFEVLYIAREYTRRREQEARLEECRDAADGECRRGRFIGRCGAPNRSRRHSFREACYSARSRRRKFLRWRCFPKRTLEDNSMLFCRFA